MEDILTTTPVVEGNVPESTSQEAQAPAQAVPETQPTTDTKVERVDNKPQAVETQRAKPSDFYRERERVRRLEQSLQTQSQRMEEMVSLIRELKNPNPDVSNIKKLTAEELLNDPEKAFQMREQRYYADLNALKEEISQLKNKESVTERTKMEREALEMLFPKSSPDANESLEQRLRNAERVELIESILQANPDLDAFSKVNPKAAAKYLLVELNQQRPQSSPNAIPKTLMGAVQRGSPGAGRKVSAEDAMTDYKKMAKEMELKPELRFNKEHKAKRDQLLADAERLAKESGSNKQTN